MLPAADAIIVAPATVNTINKWAAGITDTLVLGLLIEGYGLGRADRGVPYTNKVMALHPALHESLAKLRDWGVHVLFGDDVCRARRPRADRPLPRAVPVAARAAGGRATRSTEQQHESSPAAPCP